MKLHRATPLLVLVSLIDALSPSLLPAEPPARKLRPVPFTAVKLSDGLWAPRIETNRRETVPHNIATCENTGRIANYSKAAAKQGKFEGIYFNDSDVYKMLEGVSYTLATHRDTALEAKLDEIIAKIASAQEPDGYLNTYYTLAEPGKRWTDLPVKHELYCAGHLFEAAVAHHRATSKRSLLDVATKFADHIDSVFGPGKRSGVCGHEEIELALVKLYEVTGEERYLRLAAYFIDERGRGTDRPLFGEYCQDHKPVREQSDIVGHAVRATYLYSGVADIAAYTGDKALIDAMERVWTNVTKKKMYVTGGIGTSARNEGFTVDYDLPNESAYAETCASIGMALWNYRLFLLHGDGRFTDVFEQVLLNGLLSGVGLDGKKFFYVNPLSSRGKHHRQPWFDCACCPTNVVRFLPSVGGYMYSSSDDAVWVNFYATSDAKVSVGKPGAEKVVRIAQESRYPWSGEARLTVDPGDARGFEVRLRIPGWSTRPPAVKVNGEPLASGKPDRGYLPIRREWKAGDVIELDIPMDARRLESHPKVQGNSGRLAILRGPVVYCLEAVDNGGRVHDIALPRDAKLTAEHRPDLLGGVTVLTGRGVRVKPAGWDGDLYREAAAAEPIDVIAVPYHAWDNREPGEMAVWIPEAPGIIGG